MLKLDKHPNSWVVSKMVRRGKSKIVPIQSIVIPAGDKEALKKAGRELIPDAAV